MNSTQYSEALLSKAYDFLFEVLEEPINIDCYLSKEDVQYFLDCVNKNYGSEFNFAQFQEDEKFTSVVENWAKNTGFELRHLMDEQILVERYNRIQDLHQIHNQFLFCFQGDGTKKALNRLIDLSLQKYKVDFSCLEENLNVKDLTVEEEFCLIKAIILAWHLRNSPVEILISGSETSVDILSGEESQVPGNVIRGGDKFALHNHPGCSGVAQLSNNDLYAMARASRSGIKLPYWELITACQEKDDFRFAGIRVLKPLSDSLIEELIKCVNNTHWHCISSKINKKFAGYLQVFSWLSFTLTFDFENN